jgi:hypothetical protein
MDFSGNQYTAYKRDCATPTGCVDTGTFVTDVAARTVSFRDDASGASMEGALLFGSDASSESGARPQVFDLLGDPAPLLQCTAVILAALAAGAGCWIGGYTMGKIDGDKAATDRLTEEYTKMHP